MTCRGRDTEGGCPEFSCCPCTWLERMEPPPGHCSRPANWYLSTGPSEHKADCGVEQIIDQW